MVQLASRLVCTESPEMTPESQPFNRELRPPWLLIGVVIVVMLVNSLFLYSPRWLGSAHDSVTSGLMLGAVLFLAMFGGLWGRTWISGWLLTMLSVAVGLLLTVLADWGYGSAYSAKSWNNFLLIPAVTLSLCAPLVGLRSLRGWSLARGGQVEIPRPAHRVEDLFLFCMVTACAITLAQIALGRTPGRGAEFSMMLVFFCSSCLFVVPVALATFRCSRWSRRLCFYALITAIACIGLGVVARASNATWQQYKVAVAPAPWLILVWLLGIFATLRGGYRLTRYAARQSNDSTRSAGPFEPSESSNAPSVSSSSAVRWLLRIQTAGILLVALGFVVGRAVQDQLELAMYRQLEQPADFFDAAVERVDVFDGRIMGVVMSATATEEDVRRVARRAPQIERLSLAGTRLGDDSLNVLKQFPALSSLDLSRTAITDRGLLRLKQVYEISLADTQVTLPAALQYCQSMSTQMLDLSGTGITDEMLGRSAGPVRLISLKLARNPISDAGVKTMFDNQLLPMWLDLSDTGVSGECLLRSTGPQVVILDGTPITDAVLGKLLASPTFPCTDISLRRTSITAAMLPALSGHSIALGHGRITEADLINLPSGSFGHLKLNGPEFTGKALTLGKLRVGNIDFSGSSVTDDVLRDLGSIGWLGDVKLCNTDVSIDGVLSLKARFVDLRGTKISGPEIIKHLKRFGSNRIQMRHEAFQPQDLLNLRGTYVLIDRAAGFKDW